MLKNNFIERFRLDRRRSVALKNSSGGVSPSLIFDAREVKRLIVFIKYSMVGVTGTAIDVGSLYIFVDILHIHVLAATLASFLLAAVNNFIMNKVWTFENRNQAVRKQFIKFFIVSSVGLVLTEICMALLVYAFSFWYVASKLATSSVVLGWNFLANKYWTFKDAVRSIAPPDVYLFDVSIIIPAYNEEQRIEKTIEAIDRFFFHQAITRQIIVVDDGSSDGTESAVLRMRDRVPDLTVIRYNNNRGKGFAVKTGIEISRGRYVLFADADNSTPIEEFEGFHRLLQNHDIVIGSRYMPGSDVTIRQPLYRIVIGRLANFLIRLFLLDDIRDTQCGFKAFHQEAAQNIFSRMKVNRYGFDIELLSIARMLRYSIHETPISWYNSPQSRVRPLKDAVKTFFELLYIKMNVWSGRYE